jgi:hypothetical protein
VIKLTVPRDSNKIQRNLNGSIASGEGDQEEEDDEDE